MPPRILVPALLCLCLLPAGAQSSGRPSAATTSPVAPGFPKTYQKTFVNEAGEGMRWDFDAFEWLTLKNFATPDEAAAKAAKWNEMPAVSDREKAIQEAGYRYVGVGRKVFLRRGGSAAPAVAQAPVVSAKAPVPASPKGPAAPSWVTEGEVELLAADCGDAAEAQALAARFNQEARPGAQLAAARAAGYRFEVDGSSVVLRKPGRSVPGPAVVPIRIPEADRWMAGSALRLRAGETTGPKEAEVLAAKLNDSLAGSPLQSAASMGYQFIPEGKAVVFGIGPRTVAAVKPVSVAAAAQKAEPIPAQPVPVEPARPVGPAVAPAPVVAAAPAPTGELPAKLRKTFVNSAGTGMRYDFDLGEWASLSDQATADEAARLAQAWNEAPPGTDREATLHGAGFRYLAQGKRIILRRTAGPGAAVVVAPAGEGKPAAGAATPPAVPDLLVRWSEEAAAFVGPDGQPVKGVGLVAFRPRARIERGADPAVVFTDESIVVAADPAKLDLGGVFTDPVSERICKAARGEWERGVVRSPTNPAVAVRLPETRPSYFRPLPDAMKKDFTNLLGLPMRWAPARNGWVNAAGNQLHGGGFVSEVADNLNGKRPQAAEETAAREAGYRYSATGDGQLALLLPPALAPAAAKAGEAVGGSSGALASEAVTARWDGFRTGWVRSDNQKLVALPGTAGNPNAVGLVKDTDGREVLLLGKERARSLSEVPPALALPGTTLRPGGPAVPVVRVPGTPAAGSSPTVAPSGSTAGSVASIPAGAAAGAAQRVAGFRNKFGHDMEWDGSLACYVRLGAAPAKDTTLVNTLNQSVRDGKASKMEADLARAYGYAYFLRNGRLCFGLTDR